MQGLLSLAEVSLQISQSVIIGYLGQYFVIVAPTPENTRDAYLYASGRQQCTLLLPVLFGSIKLTSFLSLLSPRVYCFGDVCDPWAWVSRGTEVGDDGEGDNHSCHPPEGIRSM